MRRTVLLQSLVLALAAVILAASITWCVLRVGEGLTQVQIWLTFHSHSVLFWGPGFVFLAIMAYGAALAVPLWGMTGLLHLVGHWCGWYSVVPTYQDCLDADDDSLDEVA